MIAALIAAQLVLLLIFAVVWHWFGHVREIRLARLQWTGSVLRIDNSRTTNIAYAPQWPAAAPGAHELVEYYRHVAEAATAERDAARSLLAARHRTDLAVDIARAERDCTAPLPVTEIHVPVDLVLPPPEPQAAAGQWRPVRHGAPPLPPPGLGRRRTLEGV